jgi:hypothetical protein
MDTPQIYEILEEPEKVILSDLHLSLSQFQEGKFQEGKTEKAIETLKNCKSEHIKFRCIACRAYFTYLSIW